MNVDLKFLNAFNSIPGVGPVTLRSLKNHFGSFQTAWAASESALKEVNLNEPTQQAILWKRPSLNPDREMQKLIKEKIWLISDRDEDYPEILHEISNSPAALYGTGNIASLKNTTALGVVGTRKPTHYGLEATEKITGELARAGVTIVSGLATGIDSRAHATAIENSAKTIAVLGSGLDQNSLFPQENRGLMRRIIESGGAALSEYPPGTPALKEHFPQRNRIISGLSQGILVIEAREKSGALITARFALEQNREVFALPGSIFTPTAVGPNRLIQDGAKLILSATDIFTELGIDYNKEEKKKTEGLLNEKESMLLELLEEPLGVDFIKEKTGLDTPVIVTSLSMLELKGLVKNLGGDTYQKI